MKNKREKSTNEIAKEIVKADIFFSIKCLIADTILSIVYFKERKNIKGAIMGAIIGDALGVPFEFKNKEEIGKVKIKKIDKWSDDSSMILCTMQSLVELEDYSSKDIADKYIKWLYEGYWTPQGIVWDCGSTTAHALRLYRRHGILTGVNDEDACGNGSLMRVIPILFYVNQNIENRFDIIREFSSITHSNIKCIIACAIYIELGLNLLNGMDKKTAYSTMQKTIIDKYKEYPEELNLFSKILFHNIYEYNPDSLSGNGYVICSLESALYSFMSCNNYIKSIITAISFGEDTDTIACITGGLSGLYYGYNKIPKRYIKRLDRAEDIIKLLNNFVDIYGL